MKVLWLCNVLIPEAAIITDIPCSSFGGWLSGLYKEIIKSDVELMYSFPCQKKVIFEKGNLEVYGFSSSNDFTEILVSYKPDVIHIFGTEFRHAYEMIRCANTQGLSDIILVGIQGLVSVISQHYISGIPKKYLHCRTFHDFIRHTSILSEKKNFEQRGEYEVLAIEGVKHITGRTDWDKACTLRINPSLNYHFCNESLRSPFYKQENKWNINECEKHSIFVSQCSYPIKGFHYVLEALPDILEVYPDTHVYTTGRNPLNRSFKYLIRQNTYELYLTHLLRKYDLTDKVTFLGDLDEEAMCDRFRRSNVFVSASTIENSPNSLGEAMLLGVPCVSSDVGGIKNLMKHEDEGFVYPYDEPYMLAYYVKKIFADEQIALRISEKAQLHAMETHDVVKNARCMLDIYNEIIDESHRTNK